MAKSKGLNTELDVLRRVANGIALLFGMNCEVVIYDIIKSTAIHIENSDISGVSVGDSLSNDIPLDTPTACIRHMENGKIIRSCRTVIQNKSGNPHYIFEINYDITSFVAFEGAVQSIIGTGPKSTYSDTTNEVNELLMDLIYDTVNRIGLPPSMMSRDDKIRALKLLQRSGAFLITGSGDQVSRFFNISKFTLYHYLKQPFPGDDEFYDDAEL